MFNIFKNFLIIKHENSNLICAGFFKSLFVFGPFCIIKYQVPEKVLIPEMFLKNLFLSACKCFFFEIFITGKGYRWARSSCVQDTRFGLLLGLKAVFDVLLPKGVIFLGINKKKVVLASYSIMQLYSFGHKIQQLKVPKKYYLQGVCFRFKYRKLQNFRHKKRK